MATGTEKEHRLITVGKWAGAIAGIIGLVATAWTGIARVNDLVQTVQENTETIDSLRADNERIEREAGERVDRVIEAVQARSERDQEIITQLRIAVAALEAVNGRTATGSVGTSAGTADPPARITVDSAGRIRLPDRPADIRIGAREALDRAGTLASADDPLSSLDGL
jgi:hypothetical protein